MNYPEIKLHSITTIILLFSTTLAFASNQCTSASNYFLHTGASAANSDDGYCFQTPQEMNVKIYEFGLCKSAISPIDKSNCEPIYSSQTGNSFNLSVGSVASLMSNVNLPEGTYTHGYVVISNVTSIKTVISFAQARTDDRGNIGTVCFTDGRSIDNSNSIISCGANDDAALPSVETIGLIGPNNSYANTELSYTVIMNGEAVVSDLYMVDSTGALSSGAVNDFAIFGSQRLQSPVVVSPNTQQLDIGFTITDGVSIGFSNQGGGGTPVDAAFEGIRFRFSAR